MRFDKWFYRNIYSGSNGTFSLGLDLHHVRVQRGGGLHLHPQQEHHQVHQDQTWLGQAEDCSQDQEEQQSSSSRQYRGG